MIFPVDIWHAYLTWQNLGHRRRSRSQVEVHFRPLRFWVTRCKCCYDGRCDLEWGFLVSLSFHQWRIRLCLDMVTLVIRIVVFDCSELLAVGEGAGSSCCSCGCRRIVVSSKLYWYRIVSSKCTESENVHKGSVWIFRNSRLHWQLHCGHWGLLERKVQNMQR